MVQRKQTWEVATFPHSFTSKSLNYHVSMKYTVAVAIDLSAAARTAIFSLMMPVVRPIRKVQVEERTASEL